MVKCTIAFGLLAATLATTVAAQQSDVKIFTPKFPNRKFNVYKKPLAISSPGSPALVADVAAKNTSVQDNIKIATGYLKSQHKISPEDIKVTDAYTDPKSRVTHVYVRQIVHGTEVSNAVANINIKDGKVISSSHTFAPSSSVSKIKRSTGSLIARANDNASLKKALESLTKHTKNEISKDALDKITISTSSNLVAGEAEYTISNIPKKVAATGTASAKKAYIQLSDGSLKPVWNLNIEKEDDWFDAQVSTEDGQIYAINNWVSNADSYKVLPKTVNTPDDGERQLVVDPADKKYSPKGWVSKDTTVGNNVWAQNNPTGGNTWKTNYRPKAAAGNKFDYPLDLTKEPDQYVDAAITQLFYTVNTMHDLSYAYGFDEVSGNFQDINYTGKGKGNDAVVAFAQDGSGTNNANFATPPDGRNGRMRMYIFTKTTPKRDGDFEQDIVAHEYTHGISNRLTGGPANSNCLNGGESGGMGEGWSDTVANLLRIKAGDTRSLELIMGKYSFNRGIRKFPYSTSKTTNPETYATLDDGAHSEVHAIGATWAGILYEVIWNLIDASGSKIGDLFTHDLSTGNSIALQLIIDGMKLQPCNPTFIDARDAIIQAEENLTEGKYKCDIWKGFAKRGLGVNASFDGTTHSEDDALPDECY
ncbi:hypothetical protein GGI12_002163 [Dipsacomyces acuminosporus]|nr:hypothetical protein GGI12_002163 [Dipsacomyces acuminosporus]